MLSSGRIALLGVANALDAARRATVTLAGYLVASTLLSVGLALLTLAAYRGIALALGDITASIIVGSVYLLSGLIALIVLQARRP